jgi:uncharacterized protein (DUF736 family)
MTQIGSLIRVSDGFRGRLRTLALDVELSLWRCEASGEKAPDYRVYRGGAAAGPEVGAAWKQHGERAGDYFAVVLDDPSFAQPIRATLVRVGHDDAWALLWSRRSRRQAAA